MTTTVVDGMFTGIVEHQATVVSVVDLERGSLLVVDAGQLASGLGIGDSVAINGTCLTVVEIAGSRLTFEAVGETLDRTNLGDVATGHTVNLELPMVAGGRFDGHIVQGHVDGMGTVRSVEADGDGRRMRIEVSPSLMRYIVEKGSITVDGVSLTVATVDDDGLEVALIPHTLKATTLGSRDVSDRVNIEVDVLAKYVERLLGASL